MIHVNTMATIPFAPGYEQINYLSMHSTQFKIKWDAASMEYGLKLKL